MGKTQLVTTRIANQYKTRIGTETYNAARKRGGVMEFNIGDRVVCTTRVDGFYDTEGIAGTVVTSGERDYGVVFDVNVNGHSLDGRCLYGHGLWVCPEELSPLHPIKKASEREYISI